MNNHVEFTNYEEEDVGKLVKSSKKKYEWTFMFQGRQHKCQIYWSAMTGKIRIFYNNNMLHYEKKYLP